MESFFLELCTCPRVISGVGLFVLMYPMRTGGFILPTASSALSRFAALSRAAQKREKALSPVHTSDAVEPPTVGGTHFDAYEYLTGSYSGV